MKKITSIFLILTMTITTNGLFVFADSVNDKDKESVHDGIIFVASYDSDSELEPVDPDASYDDGIGPGTVPDNTVSIRPTGEFTVDEKGNIKDVTQKIVGNTSLGDKVNADGSFTAANGITVYPDGVVTDAIGNTYNLDGSITIVTGAIYYLNGDVKDTAGIIYHTDGSITFPDGTTKDAGGIMHYADGSIMLPNGTKYMADGMVVSPGETQNNQAQKVVKVEKEESKETPGFWNYDPATNKWKFENKNADGTKIIYTDKWIKTKNAQGQDIWYSVDREGNMVTGWLKCDGEYYFMSPDPNSRGEIVKGTVIIDGKIYTFDDNTGALKRGDVPKKNVSVLGADNHISGVDGVWHEYNTGEKYFATYVDLPDGSRIEVPPSGWYMVDSNYHYFDKYGIPETGLVEIDKKYYYFNEDGTMKEGGEVIIGDTVYVLDKATGACRTMRRR